MPPSVTFAGQNWLITPAALAVNEPKPPGIGAQKWLLVLSGVTIINLQGNVASDWLRQTITILPDMNAPMQWAINKWSIPVPQNPDHPFVPVFSLVEWAPFAAVSSTFNKSSGAVDIGFAVDVWRPTHFIQTYRDANSQLISNVFAGVDVDVAVINSNSNLQRVSYNFTLLGTIAFTPNPIT
jgi:hypothetical protein